MFSPVEPTRVITPAFVFTVYRFAMPSPVAS